MRYRVVEYKVIETGHRFTSKDVMPNWVTFQQARLDAYRGVLRNNLRFDTTALRITRFSVVVEVD